MVVTETEFLLVNPDKVKLGWGMVHFISFLQVRLNPSPLHTHMAPAPLVSTQDVDVTPDPADTCSLYIVCSRDSTLKRPALSAKFQFDDHIRCISARQLLLRYKDNLRLAKMTRITKMLHLPLPEASPTSSVAAPVSLPHTVPHPLTDTGHNLGIISVTPTPRASNHSPSSSNQLKVTSSVLNNVFMPPARTPHNPQEFEMSDFKVNHPSRLNSLAEADAPAIYDSPVKLAPPREDYSSESSSQSLGDSLNLSLTNVHIGTDSLLVRYDHSSKSHTPETPIEQSSSSHTDEQLSTSVELQLAPGRPADGYKVEPFGGGEVEHDVTPSRYDSEAAQGDGEKCLPDLTTQMEEADSGGDHGNDVGPVYVQPVEQAFAQYLTSNTSPSQLLEEEIHPLDGGEDIPQQLPTNNTLLTRNVAMMTQQLPTMENVEGHVSTANGKCPEATHQLFMSSNIIWDVPLLEELKHNPKEERSRSDSPTQAQQTTRSKIT